MQQKKIILAILSILYSSTYSMEQNLQQASQNDIKINSTTGFPEGCIKCGNVFLPSLYLNDVILGNILPDGQAKQVFVKRTALKEYKTRLSNLPGADKGREDATWSFNSSNSKEERTFYLNQDLEKINKKLNDFVDLLNKK